MNPVGAREFLTKDDDGLGVDWNVERLHADEPVTAFINPPFKSATQWVQKALHEFSRDAFDIGLLLVPSSLVNSWCLPLLRKFHWGVFSPRLTFSKPSKTRRTLKPAKTAANFDAFLVLLSKEPTRHVPLFVKHFSGLLEGVNEPIKAVPQ